MNQDKKLTPYPWLLLPARLVLFLLFQSFFALYYVLTGAGQGAWEQSAAWWPLTVTLANFVCWVLLNRLLRAEGISYSSLFKIQKENIKKDLLFLAVILLVSGPVGYFPNVLGAQWIFGNQETAMGLFIRPLPMWATIFGAVLFPLTQGMVELAYYYLYIQPRLEKQLQLPVASMLISAFFLAAQHITIPFLWNGQFILWRLIMFFPFALLLAVVLRWKPRLLPYLAVIHVLMDFSVTIFLFPLAY